MEDMQYAIVQAQSVKSRHEENLMRKANVVGVGVGLRRQGGEILNQPAIVVSVTEKKPLDSLMPDDVIPSELDGVPVDVQAVGHLRAFS